jgi:hypothetical protein
MTQLTAAIQHDQNASRAKSLTEQQLWLAKVQLSKALFNRELILYFRQNHCWRSGYS